MKIRAQEFLSQPILIISLCYVPPLLVYASSIFLFEIMYSCNSELGLFQIFTDEKKINKEFVIISLQKNSYLFYAALIGFYSSCIVGTIYSVATVINFSNVRQRLSIFSMAILASTIGSLIILFSGSFYELCIVNDFYYFPLKRIQDLSKLSGTDDYFMLEGLGWIFGFGTFVSNFAWWFCGASATVIYFPATEHNDLSRVATDIRLKMINVRSILYVSTIVLLANTICIGAWLNWSNTPILSDSAAVSRQQMTASLTLLYGTVMTLILIAAFLPAILYLRRKSMQLAVRASDAGAETHWLEENGLQLDFRILAKDLATALSPMLAGPIGSILASFSVN